LRPLSLGATLLVTTTHLAQIVSLFLFFFQAEAGIRDRNVTGVQTCALPISANSTRAPSLPSSSSRSTTPSHPRTSSPPAATPNRSEERRVGKEGRERGPADE